MKLLITGGAGFVGARLARTLLARGTLAGQAIDSLVLADQFAPPADLLADLPEERKQGLLALMEKEDADDVRKLLTYPEESAGGIMTTEFASIRPNLAAAQAIEALRAMADEVETMFYVYVTDAEDHLVGAFSLNNLIFASPGAMVKDFMIERVISVNLTDDQETVAQTVAKYDLLAVPVVDDQNRLHGIVTADDALDKVIPTAWKKRLPRFYR